MTPPSETPREQKAKKVRPERYGFGKVYQRPPSTAWYIAWYADGKERRESVARVLGKPMAAVTARDAHRLLSERLKAKARGELVTPKYERATVAEMLAEYEQHLEGKRPATIGKFRATLRSTASWLGAERIHKLDLPYLEALAAAREKGGWARSTVKQRLGVLHSALVYWKRAKRIASVPDMPGLTIDNARQGSITDAEVVLLASAMPAVAADITWAMSYLGWRISEVLGFTWDRVDLAERVLHLDKEKAGPGRMRPLTEDALLAVFERRWRARIIGQPWVFWCTLRGGRNGVQVTETWYRDQWRAARTATGLTDKIPHDFRRSLYVRGALAGVDLATAMNLVGHRSLTTATRYQVFDLTRQRAGLERLEAHRARAGALTAEEHATLERLTAKLQGRMTPRESRAGSQ